MIDVIFINFSSVSIFTGLYCVPLSTEVLDGLGHSGGNKVLECSNEWLRYVPGKVGRLLVHNHLWLNTLLKPKNHQKDLRVSHCNYSF